MLSVQNANTIPIEGCNSHEWNPCFHRPALPRQKRHRKGHHDTWKIVPKNCGVWHRLQKGIIFCSAIFTTEFPPKALRSKFRTFHIGPKQKSVGKFSNFDQHRSLGPNLSESHEKSQVSGLRLVAAACSRGVGEWIAGCAPCAPAWRMGSS